MSLAGHSLYTLNVDVDRAHAHAQHLMNRLGYRLLHTVADLHHIRSLRDDDIEVRVDGLIAHGDMYAPGCIRLQPIEQPATRHTGHSHDAGHRHRGEIDDHRQYLGCDPDRPFSLRHTPLPAAIAVASRSRSAASSSSRYRV